MSINILLTGGRAPATYYFARLLKEQGHNLFMAECLPRYICRRSRLFESTFYITAPNEDRDAYIQDLIALIRANNIDLLIPTCEEVFHIAAAFEELSRYCRVFCEPLEKINALHHKGLFIDMLTSVKNSSIKIPSTFVLDTNYTRSKSAIASIFEANQISMDQVYVCKPAYSRFGTDVVYKKGDKMIDFLVQRKNIWVVQEKIEGRQVCTYAIADGGDMKCYSAYLSNDKVGIGATIYFEPFKNRQLEEFVVRFIEQNHYSGQIAFDLIMTDNGEFYPIECNPRTTSGICLFPIKKYSVNPQTYLVGSETTMLGLAMLQTLLSRRWFRQLSKMLKAKDIIWNPSDKKVFFDQLTSFLYLLKAAKKKKISSYRMSTLDIEWNGRKDGGQ